jgi:mycothiol synthase
VTISHRRLTDADAEAAAAILSAYDAFHAGDTDGVSADDVLDWWRGADDDGRIGVTDPEGALVGLGVLRRRGDHCIVDNFVHPDFLGRGVGAHLLEWSERCAAADAIASLRVAFNTRDTRARELVESRGYRYVRSFYRMVVDLDSAPAPPGLPQGFRLERFQPGEERIYHEVLEHAFAEHWGHVPRTYEEWSRSHGPLEGRICYLVRDEAGAPVAVAICDEQRYGTAFVAVLGVRAQWRGRGLGEALLRQAFSDLYALGRRRIALGVDAGNETGAIRLYERVGMRVDRQDDVYEKSLRPDVDGGGSKLAGS